MRILLPVYRPYPRSTDYRVAYAMYAALAALVCIMMTLLYAPLQGSLQGVMASDESPPNVSGAPHSDSPNAAKAEDEMKDVARSAPFWQLLTFVSVHMLRVQVYINILRTALTEKAEVAMQKAEDEREAAIQEAEKSKSALSALLVPPELV